MGFALIEMGELLQIINISSHCCPVKNWQWV